jgi:hypothetical protein
MVGRGRSPDYRETLGSGGAVKGLPPRGRPKAALDGNDRVEH